MFAHLHIFAYIAAASIVLMIIAGVIGGYLERSQPPESEDQQQVLGKPFTAISGILFVILCMAAVPLILRFFTHMQGLIGNSELGMVTFIRQHERTIAYIVWGVLVCVSLFLLPTMMREAGTGSERTTTKVQ